MGTSILPEVTGSITRIRPAWNQAGPAAAVREL